MINIRYMTLEDKPFWYSLDKHLQEEEEAQHFYRKLGYKDCGGFVPTLPGYEQPMELFLEKGI